MVRRIEDFIGYWLYDAEATIKVWERIPDNIKTEKINDDVRSLERLAWHITQSNSEMVILGGIQLPIQLDDNSTPPTFNEIIKVYKTTTQQIAEAVQNQWTDDQLDDEVEMYGERWSKGKLLYILLGHQGHHRSQMTVIMRVLGIPVPGTWGPSKEEWAQMGMTAMV